jgi:hypothetical protein
MSAGGLTHFLGLMDLHMQVMFAYILENCLQFSSIVVNIRRISFQRDLRWTQLMGISPSCSVIHKTMPGGGRTASPTPLHLTSQSIVVEPICGFLNLWNEHRNLTIGYRREEIWPQSTKWSRCSCQISPTADDLSPSPHPNWTPNYTLLRR